MLRKDTSAFRYSRDLIVTAHLICVSTHVNHVCVYASGYAHIHTRFRRFLFSSGGPCRPLHPLLKLNGYFEVHYGLGVESRVFDPNLLLEDSATVLDLESWTLAPLDV